MTFLFCRPMDAICSGTVKTTWKYSTSSSWARCSSSHLALASAWHFGQWRSRQELYVILRYPQRSQPSTWPPSTAVRHTSIERMVRRCPELMDEPFAPRYAGPCRRKTSATSRPDLATAIYKPASSDLEVARFRWCRYWYLQNG